MKVKQILDWLNAIAPFDTAEGFDNVGLLMGDPAAEVHEVLFGMDVTEQLAQEAIDRGAELIITHHPFIFHALKRIDYTGPQGRTLCRLAQHGVNVIAAHTNWDQAEGGVGDSLAHALSLSDVTSPDPYIRLGTLPSPMSAAELSAHLRAALRVEPRCYPASDTPITRVAVAGGAYGEGYLAALQAGAQAYVVGEIAHHEIMDAHMRGMTIYDAGHFPTELPGVVNLYMRFLAEAAQSQWDAQAHLHSLAPYAGALCDL